MKHINLEKLARLVDEPATAEETDHLAECGGCRTELAGLREQTGMLAALPDPEAPPRVWSALQGQLRAEGMIGPAIPLRPGGRWGAALSAHGSAARPALRLAASLALLLLGGAGGYAIRGTAGIQDREPGTPRARLVAEAARPMDPAKDPAQALRSAESAYLAALARYAEASDTVGLQDPGARLATLESIVAATGAALHEAPADPVINGYHLAARAQRDATLRLVVQTNTDHWF